MPTALPRGPGVAGSTGRAVARHSAVKRALRLARREPAAFWLSCRVACWILILSVAARTFSLPAALRLLRPLRVGRRSAVPETIVAGRLAHRVDALLRLEWLVFNPSCWKRAALLHRYLALEGIETRIV